MTSLICLAAIIWVLSADYEKLKTTSKNEMRQLQVKAKDQPEKKQWYAPVFVEDHSSQNKF